MGVVSLLSHQYAKSKLTTMSTHEDILFDLYTRSSDREEWSVADRCIPKAHAEQRAERLREAGTQAKLEPSDPAYRPSFDDAALAILEQLKRVMEQTAEAIHLYVKGDREKGPQARAHLRQLQANIRSLEAYFVGEGLPRLDAMEPGNPGEG
jgi:hypothetical protein